MPISASHEVYFSQNDERMKVSGKIPKELNSMPKFRREGNFLFFIFFYSTLRENLKASELSLT
jgi:hypothetical protein